VRAPPTEWTRKEVHDELFEGFEEIVERGQALAR